MPSYHATCYTAWQGLPRNAVRALLQTSDGYIWVGTSTGLAQLDGVKFKVFSSSNTPAMPNDAINALAEDRQDCSLWTNAGKALPRYHNQRFERFDEETGVPQPPGRLWPARRPGMWYTPNSGPDVVLTNIHLSGVSSIECVVRLRRLLPRVRVIMLTVEDGTEQVFESLKAGATVTWSGTSQRAKSSSL